MEYPTVYRHSKTGNLYLALGESVHTENGEKCVVYQSLVTGKIWHRPFEMFFEHVPINGKIVPRFAPVPLTEIHE